MDPTLLALVVSQVVLAALVLARVRGQSVASRLLTLEHIATQAVAYANQMRKPDDRPGDVLRHALDSARILDEKDIALAILATREVAYQIGMSSGATAALSTAVSELVTNVTKYADRGLISMRPAVQIRRPGIEVIVEDRGPGIADIELAMKENVSTGGTLGLGLPGTRRLVDEFDIESQPGQGTRVRIIKWS